MSAKMGRPTDNPRTIRISPRLNEEEAKLLEECAECLNITKTEVVVRGIKKVYADIKK